MCSFKSVTAQYIHTDSVYQIPLNDFVYIIPHSLKEFHPFLIFLAHLSLSIQYQLLPLPPAHLSEGFALDTEMDLSFLDGEDDFDEDVSRCTLHDQVHVCVCVCVCVFVCVCMCMRILGVLCYEPGVSLFHCSDFICKATVTQCMCSRIRNDSMPPSLHLTSLLFLPLCPLLCLFLSDLSL
jgi:hypothetical protein